MSLQINCGYARTAIRELSALKRGSSRQQIDKSKRSQELQELFAIPTFTSTVDLFSSSSNPLLPTRFEKQCDTTLTYLKKNKWHPSSLRLEYVDTFSVLKWKDLSATAKESHSLSCCNACYNSHPSLQKAYPGKPVYEPQTVMSLPALDTEKGLVKSILAELNPIWENQFAHKFTAAIPKLLPECKLVQKKKKTEHKREDRARKRKIVAHVNDHLSQNTTMSVLAEAESLARFRCKRLALSYERPISQSKAKSH